MAANFAHIRLCLCALFLCLLVSGSSAGWVKLLDNKGYGGTWNTAYPTLAAGTFTKIKAVHRSGYVTCDTASAYPVDGNPWQECNNGATITYISFQLAKNDALVLTQPNWHTLPPQCAVPSTPTGDIECDVSLSLSLGDSLTPTWKEAWDQSSLHDNGGTHYVDLYGWTDVTTHVSCTRVREANPAAPSGVYWLDTGTGPRQVFCLMEGNGGGWTVVMQYDRSVSLGTWFAEYAPQGRLVDRGNPSHTAPNTNSRPMPAYAWNQVAVACLDGTNQLKPSTLRVHDGEWVGASFITGSSFPSVRQQSNVFGYTNGYETLFWASGADWRELNLIDTSDTVAASTHNRGWGFWKGGGQSDGECAGQRIDSGNQLVLMVREPAENVRLRIGNACSNNWNSIKNACPAGFEPFSITTNSEWEQLQTWAFNQAGTAIMYANAFSIDGSGGYMKLNNDGTHSFANEGLPVSSPCGGGPHAIQLRAGQGKVSPSCGGGEVGVAVCHKPRVVTKLGGISGSGNDDTSTAFCPSDYIASDCRCSGNANGAKPTTSTCVCYAALGHGSVRAVAECTLKSGREWRRVEGTVGSWPTATTGTLTPISGTGFWNAGQHYSYALEGGDTDTSSFWNAHNNLPPPWEVVFDTGCSGGVDLTYWEMYASRDHEAPKDFSILVSDAPSSGFVVAGSWSYEREWHNQAPLLKRYVLPSTAVGRYVKVSFASSYNGAAPTVETIKLSACPGNTCQCRVPLAKCASGWSLEGCSCYSSSYGCGNDGQGARDDGAGSCAPTGSNTMATAVCSQVDNCTPESCKNGGVCSNGDGDGSITCACAPGFSGVDCADRLECSAISPPSHASVSCTLGRSVGRTCHVTCDAGYAPSAPVARECQANMEWSGSNPVCSPVECGAMPPVSQGTVTCSGFLAGDACTVACNFGYAASMDTVSCGSDGQWSGTPQCTMVEACTGLKFGGSQAAAAESCFAILDDAITCGAGTPPNGPYYIRTSQEAVGQLTLCDFTTDGGGWTYVAEPGRSTSDGTDVTVESRYGYHQWVFDLRGMSYDEAMFERITPLWCGSWGYGSANFINSCSMGVAFDQNHYHYFNGNVGHELRKQDFSLRAVGGSIRCSSCWVDSNGLLQASDAVAVAVKSDGSKIKWTSPSRKGNTYLEHMNFDAWVGYAGGCDLSGSVTTFQQRAWVRGPRSRVQEPASTCAEIKDRAPSSADGVYTLTAKDGTTRDVFCDMTTDGGGWTYVNEPGRRVDTIYDIFEEVQNGYHHFVYDLAGMVFDEVLVVRSQAHWCNSWGSGVDNFIGRASMGIAVDKSWYHYYSGQYSPYRLLKQVFGIKRPGGTVTCSSCWANTNMQYDTDMAALDVSPGGNGKSIKWTPSSKRNAYLEFENYDAFIGQAGGCNSIAGGKSGHHVFVRAAVVPPVPTARSCADHLKANPSASNGLYDIELPGGSTVRAYCDMVNGGWTHCGSALASGSGHTVDIGLATAGDHNARTENQYSRDCSAMLGIGASVAFSKDPDAVGPVTTQAQITGDPNRESTHTSYPIQGDGLSGSSFGTLRFVHKAYSCYASGNAKRGPEILGSMGSFSTTCMSNGHYSGINVCLCGNGQGAYQGQAETGPLYFWVKPWSCSDGLKSGDETDVDCGGSCDACASGSRCLQDSDCADGFCAGQCVVDNSGFALYASGSGGHMRTDTPVDLTSAENAVTVEAWVLARTPTALGQVVLDAADSGNIRVTMGLEEGTGLAMYSVDNRGAGDATAYVTSVEAVPSHRWVHIAFVSAAGKTTVYLDGRPAGQSFAVQPAPGERTRVLVGRNFESPGTSFAGVLDDVRLWVVAVPLSSIGADVGTRAGCVLAYSFNSVTKASLPRGHGTISDDSTTGATAQLECGDDENGCVAPAARARALCGDGYRQGLEMCDDGNQVSGDGCSATCSVEAGFVCRPVAGVSLAADACSAGTAQLLESFEGASAVEWASVSGPGTIDARAAGHGRVATGGMYGAVGESASMTYTSVVVPSALTAKSQLQFLASVPAAVRATPLAITLIDAGSASVAPLQCVTDAACGGVKSFTMCIGSASAPAGCDEAVVWGGAGVGVWHDVAINVADKFMAKYNDRAVSWPTSLHIVIGIAGGADAAWFRLDELRVVTLDAAGPPPRAGDVAAPVDVAAPDRCPDVAAVSSVVGDGSAGTTKAQSLASCLKILEANPLAKSGMYWVHFGHGPDAGSKVYRVWCDMETNGGGWTMWWRGIGGWPPAGYGSSNAQLWSSGSNTPIMPPTYHSRSAYHTDAYNYFRELRNVQLVKTMNLYLHPGLEPVQEQRVRMDLGPDVMLKHLSETGNLANKCQTLGNKVRFYSTERDGTTDATSDMNDVNYFMGETNQFMVYGSNYGFANSEHSGADTCGQGNSNLVTDASQLRRLDCNSASCRMNGIRHLWSYAHTSTDISSSRCMYACWSSQSDYHEVFTWAAREEMASDLSKGNLVLNNYDAIMAGCPVAGSVPFLVQSAADFTRWKLWVASQPGSDIYFANSFANNADVGYITGNKAYLSAAIPSGDRSGISGNGNSGCGGSAAYPNYDPLSIDRNGINTQSGGNYLYITCESSRSAYVTCFKPSASSASSGGLVPGLQAENQGNDISQDKCPTGTTLFTVKSNDDYERLNTWARQQTGGLYYWANVFADGTDAGYLDGSKNYVSASVTHSSKAVFSGNGNSGCGSGSGYPIYDPIPFQGGVGVTSRTEGTHLLIECESLLTAYVVCESPGSGSTTAVVMVDGSDALGGAGADASGTLHLVAVPADGSALRTLAVDLTAGAADPTAAVTAFLDATATGDVVAGTLVPPPADVELAMPATLVPPLASLGVGAPALAQAQVVGWSFVGRKGAARGTVPSIVSHDASVVAATRAAFLCGSAAMRVPDNAPGTISIPINRRFGAGALTPLNSGGSAAFTTDPKSGGTTVGVGGGSVRSTAAASDLSSLSLPVRAADKLFVSEWQSLVSQSGSLSSVAIPHSDEANSWAVTASSLAHVAGSDSGKGRLATSAAALRDGVASSGLATLPAVTGRPAQWVATTFDSDVTVESITLGSLDAGSTWGVANINGAEVQVSHTAGVAWSKVATVSGVTATTTTTITFDAPVRGRWFRVAHSSAAVAIGTLRWGVRAGSSLPPEALDVRVQIKSSSGFVFNGDGASHRGDAQNSNSYGGVLFGWTHDTVHLWAPSRRSGSAPGHVVNVGNGWGTGEHHAQEASASVRVVVSRAVTADYDSGWITVSDLVEGAAPYVQLSHGLGAEPGRVQVLVRAESGEYQGTVFEAAGACQTNGASGQYGGVVFGYSSSQVRVWAASGNGGNAAFPVIVRDGWRGSTNPMYTDVASIRVKAWLPGPSPDFETTVSLTANDNTAAFQQVTHGLGTLPGRVQVLARATTGNNAGFVFPSIGMAQATGYPATDSYGGVIASYNDQFVRLYAPNADPRNGQTRGHTIFIGDKWGGGVNSGQQTAADVDVRVWRHDPAVAGDTVTNEVTFFHSNRAPTVKSELFAMSEEELVSSSRRVTATPGQAGDALTYRITAGNEDGAFEIDGTTGDLSLAADVSINFKANPYRTMAVEARTGSLAGVGVVTVVVAGGNSAPRITGGLAHEVLEGAKAGTTVGVVEASDPDSTDSVLFKITEGNVGDAFRIAACDGTIRVAEGAPALSVVTKPTYRLTVVAYDDAPLSKNDTATVVITVMDVNDPPTCPPITRSVPENAAPGASVGVPLSANDPEGDALTWTVFSGATDVFQLDRTTGQLTLKSGASLDHEGRPSYTMSVMVEDEEPLSAMCAVTIEVTDENDAPTFLAGASPTLSCPESLQPGDGVGIIAAHDEDEGDTVTVTDVGNPQSAEFLVNADGTVVLRAGVSLDYETTSSYTIEVQLNDGNGGVHNGTVTVEVEDVNDAPTLADVTVTVDENVPAGTVIASLAPSDEDGDGVAMSVTGGNGWFVIHAGTSDLVTTATAALDYESVTSYTVDVALTDNGSPSASGSATITVNVNDVDDPPTVQSCGSTTVWRDRPGHNAVSGVVQSPHNVFNEEVATMWEFVAADAATCATKCQAKSGCAAWTYFASNYLLRGWRSQCYGRTNAYDVMEDQAVAPGDTSVQSGELLAACLAATVAEASPSGTSLGTLVAVDQDGAAVTWAVGSAAGNNANGWFAVSEAGAVTLATSDSDADGDAGTVHFLTATASDGTMTTDVLVVVTLTPVDEAPALAVPSAVAVSLPQGSPAGMTVGSPLRGVDPEGATVTYRLDGTNAALFTISATDGQITTVGEITDPQDTVYTFVAHAADQTTNEASVTFTVTVVTGNLAPVIGNQVVRLNENSPGGTAAAPAVVGTDRDAVPDALTYALEYLNDTAAVTLFNIDAATGVVSVAPSVAAGALDYESRWVYWATVVVRDDGAGQLEARATLSIELINVNEPPSCPVMTGRVSENAVGGTVASLEDATCLDAEGTTLSFHVDPASATASQFYANATEVHNTVELLVADGAVIDYETTPGRSITVPVVVTDEGGATMTMSVVVALVDVNEAPEFTVASKALAPSLPEDSVVGTAVATVQAVDQDAGNVVVYALAGSTDRMLWALDSLSGAVTLKGTLDAESAFSHDVTVSATDPSGLSDTLTFTVAVGNVEDTGVTGIYATADGAPAAPQGTTGQVEVVATFPTATPTSITIVGHDFGYAPQLRLENPSYEPDAHVTYGPTGSEYTATDCTVDPDSNKAMTCNTVAGAGAAHKWIVIVDGGGPASSGMVRTSYLPPEVETVSGGPLATAGGTEVVITGKNFGPVGTSASAVYGEARYEAACEVTADHVEIKCVSVEGRGSGLHWRVFVAGQLSGWSPGSEGTDYAAPVIHAVSGGNEGGDGFDELELLLSRRVLELGGQDELLQASILLDTAGGDTVTVRGENFGPPPRSDSPEERLMVTYGGGAGTKYTASCVFVVPHEELRCTTVAGVGANHAWRVSVGGVASALSEDLVAYHPPVLSSVTGPGAQFAETRGGVKVVLAGQQFGPVGVAHLDLVRYGPTGDELNAVSCTVSVADVEITCLTAEGTGKGHSWRVVIGGQASEVLFADTSYAAPIVSHFDGVGAVDADTRGSEAVNIHGFNFGNDAAKVTSVSYRLPDTDVVFNATDCSLTQAHETLLCLTAPGAGAALSWRVVVDGQASRNPVTAYHKPVVSGLTCPDEPGAACSQLSTDQSARVVITGDYFGSPDGQGPFVAGVSYGPTGFEYKVLNFTVVSHTRIECTTVPSMGTGMKWRVVVAGQTSDASDATTSTATPRIWSLAPSEGPTDASTRVTLRGSNWAVADATAYVDVLFGNADDKTLRRPVRMLDAAVVEPQFAHNSTEATFLVPPGLGVARALRLRVTVVYPAVGTALAAPKYTVVTDPVVFDYRPPQLDFVEVSSKFEQSDKEKAFVEATFAPDVVNDVRRLRIIGSNFGPPASLINDTVIRSVLLQPTDALGLATGEFSVAHVKVYAWTHSEITAFATEPYGAVKVSVVSAPFVSGPGLTATSGVASYADFTPRISALTGGGTGGFSTAGGETMTLEMFHLGSTQTLSVKVGNSSCPLITAAGDVIAPADVRRVVIEEPLGGEAPQVDTAWTVRCRVPPGEGRINPVTVFRNGVPSLSEAGGGATLKYSPPNIGQIMVPSPDGSDPPFRPVVDSEGVATKLNVGTKGGLVKLAGSNFGFCPEVQLSRSGVGVVEVLSFCRADPVTGVKTDVTGDPVWSQYTVAHDHTSLEFKIPPGQGSDWLMHVVTAAQSSAVPLRYGFLPPSVGLITLSGGTKPSTAGGAIVVIEGANFGFNALGPASPPVVWFENAALGIGKLMCEDVTREEATWHTRVTCKVPEGGGARHSTFVQAGDQIGELPNSLSFAPPSLSTVVTPSARRRLADVAAGEVLRGPAAGGFTVTVSGDNLGTTSSGDTSGGVCVVLTAPTATAPTTAPDGTHSGPASCNDARAAAAASAAVTVVPPDAHGHNEVSFTMPAGLGTRIVSVLAWGQAGAKGARFAYSDPVVEAVTPFHGPTNGGTEVVVNGTNYGVPGYAPLQSVQVTFGTLVCSKARSDACMADGRTCPCDVLKHDNGKITFTTPGGIGRDVPVTVQVVEDGTVVAQSVPMSFHYDPPLPVYALPYMADAQGTRIAIPGINFGNVADMPSWTIEQRRVDVTVSGAQCLNAERVKQLGQSVLHCDMQRTTVGFKNITITVAGQIGSLHAEQEAFYTLCQPGFYGQLAELCLPCPQGAVCDGAYAEPRSMPGWYNLNTTKEACEPERQHRTACNNVLPCEPKFACTGNNTCAVGYTSKPPMFRCSSCDVNYYKRAGECVECPNNPWILAVGFFVGAIVACVVGYFLNSKAVNLAFVSIGVDYFQVLAMFANSRVQWPVMIKDMFHIFSIFNLNLEITAPECSIPDLSYALKWFFIQALPLGAAGIFLMLHLALLFKKRVLMGRKKRLNSHISSMVGMFFTMLYVLYLYLTRTVLDVFDCSPTDPPDGHEYLDVVFERCWEAGGLQMTLLPFALIAMLVYVIGYPAFIFSKLYRNRHLVMEDQLLRAKGLGKTRLTNPNAYDMRKRWHKVYYHFRPDKWYWIECILARKFAIAFTALMFNKNPAFQLSVALLVMFSSYALQVKHRPYMSPSGMAAELRRHQEQAADGIGLHPQLAVNLANIETRGKKAAHRRIRLGEEGTTRRKAAATYFFDYNTVEMVLLGCAVLVNLAGVMFESNRFQSDYFQEQRDGVTLFIMFIIIASIIYYVVVVFSEVYITLYPDRRGPCSKPAKSKKRSSRGSAFDSLGASDSALVVEQSHGAPTKSVEMGNMNPMFAQAQANAASAGAASAESAARSDAHVAAMHQELARLKAENQRLKLALVVGGQGSRDASARAGIALPEAAAVERVAAKNKREFGQRRVGKSNRRRGGRRLPHGAGVGARGSSKTSGSDGQ